MYPALHTGDGRTPVLWLETTNVDFGVPGLDDSKYLSMVIAHAVAKAEKLGVALCMETHAKREATQIVDGLEGGGGRLDMRQVRIVLRPSVGVVEVGPVGYCSPRHRVTFNSRDEGSKCV